MTIPKNVWIVAAFLMIFADVFYGQNITPNNTNNNNANNNSTNTAVNNQTNQNNNRPADTAAQTNTNPTPPTDPVSTTPAPPTEPVIEDIYRLGYENDKDERNNAGIRDIIVIKVKNLKTLNDESLCKDKDKEGIRKTNCTDQKIALFLDGRKIEAVEQEAISLKGNDGTIQFHLSRKAGVNDEAWADLLGNPPLGDGFFLRKNTKVSIGLENQYAAAEPKNFDLIRIRQYRFWIFTILYIFLLFLIYRLTVVSDIIRDIGEYPDSEEDRKEYGIFRAFEFGKKDENRKPYSLARFQMAFWFLLVIGSFSYIWLITGALDIITTEILTLMGIGAGTALGAAVIDSGKRESAITDLKTKKEEITKLDMEIASLNSEIIALPSSVDPAVL